MATLSIERIDYQYCGAFFRLYDCLASFTTHTNIAAQLGIRSLEQSCKPLCSVIRLAYPILITLRM